MASVKVLITEARRMEKVMVIDADGLFLVTSDPSVVQGCRNVILTPNEAEFGRLYCKMVSVMILSAIFNPIPKHSLSPHYYNNSSIVLYCMWKERTKLQSTIIMLTMH